MNLKHIETHLGAEQHEIVTRLATVDNTVHQVLVLSPKVFGPGTVKIPVMDFLSALGRPGSPVCGTICQLERRVVPCGECLLDLQGGPAHFLL